MNGAGAVAEGWRRCANGVRLAFGCALAMALSACMSTEEMNAAFGFAPAKPQGDTVTRQAMLAGGKARPGRLGPKTVSLAGGKVIVVPPRGYCIDKASLRNGFGSGFVLIAACNSLSGEYSGADAEPVVMTVQVQPGFLQKEAPDAAALAAAMAPVKALRKVDGDGISMVQFASGGNAELPKSDPKHWRAAMMINRYLVGIALYAPAGHALSGPRGERMIVALAENMLDASPIPDFSAEAEALKAKKN